MNEITIVNNEETKVKKLSNKHRELNFARQNALASMIGVAPHAVFEALDTL